jgi:hypothetical protein
MNGVEYNVRPRYLLVAGFCALVSATPVSSQEAPPSTQPNTDLRVFFDCGFGCDFDYIRTEVDFVDYVRNREDADVHVLISFQGTGSGGREYTIEFIGLGRYETVTDTLAYISARDDTDDVRREGLAAVLAVGLMRYIGATSLAPLMRISLDRSAASSNGTDIGPVSDPWNFWVFRVSADGELEGESQQEQSSVGLELSANRTTEAWKIDIGVQGDYNEERFEIDSVTTVHSLRRSYEANILAVKSIGPHLSIGAEGSIESSTFGNEELAIQVAPAIEYNVFPYSESTRRVFTIRYGVGIKRFDYQEETIYGETQETRAAHELSAGYNTRQPWGTTGMSLNFSQYLHDSQKYRVDVSGNADVRIFRGVTLNVRASYARVRDQLSIPVRGATQEEILLRQRELQTSYEFQTRIGITYRFGSIFNNVVNPRFRRGFGGGFR